jgi:hypothetical protein
MRKIDSNFKLPSHLLFSFAALLMMVSIGCGGGSSSGSTATLTAIAVTPATASIAVGGTQQLTATGTYSNGTTANVTSTVSWTISSASVATITAGGLVTGAAAGSATVTASLTGVNGTAALTVNAATKTLSSIAVTPGTASIAAGATQQFVATATYSDGSTAVVTSTVTWTSSTPATATINAAGLATSVAQGSTTVTASLSGVSGKAVLTVTPKTLTSIAITPATPSIGIGASQQFVATAIYSDASTVVVTSTATWTSSTPATATINAAGLATSVALGSTTITASFGGMSGTTVLTVTAKTVSSLAITPTSASFAVGATQQFTATATYSDKSTANVTSTAAWSISNTAIATIDSTTGLATAVASGSTSVTAELNSVSGSTAFTVTIASGAGVNIPMFHVDVSRSGLNPDETTLTPSNVSASTFGKLFSVLVDGYVYGTPLIMSNLTVNGAKHNVLYAATENDSVFAFDSDTGALLWKRTLLNQNGTTNEAPIGGPIAPYEGVTSTPVIDTTTNTLYVVSVQKSSNTNSSAYFRLSALDITTGTITNTNVVSATVPGTNSDSSGSPSMTSLDTSCIQRAALLIANSNVYLGFGGCHSGWLLAYDESSLAQVGVFNMSPNNNGENTYGSAGGVWMGGGGPVADSTGNIYVTTGNGPYAPTTLPANYQTSGAGAWSDSVLRFDSTLNLEDSFTPDDFAFMDCNDSDLAAGGLMMIPGTSPAQVVAGGKMGRLYFLNSTNLGGEHGTPGQPDPNITELEWGAAAPGQSALATPYPQSCTVTSPTTDPNYGDTFSATVNSFEIFGTAAYFNGSIYLGITPTNTPGPTPEVPSGIRQFTYTSGQWVPGTDTTLYTQENTREGTPFISANGASDGIMWMVDQGQPLQTPDTSGPTSATLRAYNASDLSAGELYDSNMNASDTPGYGIKFSSPVVANGKVYISTGHDLTTVTNPQGEIDVYGLN